MFAGKYEFKSQFLNKVHEVCSKNLADCSTVEKYSALVALLLEDIRDIRTETVAREVEEKEKKVYYFSMEFLIGRLLENYLINTGIREIASAGLKDLGIDLAELCEVEKDPGLGNGGLGRLAACFMDSMASLDIPSTGMGIRYQFGLFRQKIENGYQVEHPDAWLDNGYPWELRKPEYTVEVKFGGYVDRRFENGKMSFEHKEYTSVKAVPYDVPVVGFGGRTVNHIRLWRAMPAYDTVDMHAFNTGDYAMAMKERSEIEAISCILYPDDSNGAGRVLRLKQEYFFVSAGINSIIRRYEELFGQNAWEDLPKHVAIHINDTHPTLCIPELMRVLMDEKKLEWNDAWDIVTKTVSFTNHTVLPEAMEKWSIDLFKGLLPRIYMIVDEINRRWRGVVESRVTNVNAVMRATAPLWDGEVRMANLSIIGSYSVNGVAALHSSILEQSVFREFYDFNPEQFNNKTNGVSHRRFMVQSNRGLKELISSAIGDEWIRLPSKLTQLDKYEEDKNFLEELAKVKRQNKVILAKYIKEQSGLTVDPDSVFDIQVKRFHAYKRQLLNAFKILNLYNILKEKPDLDINPYTFVFSGKAAQGYALAKEIIKFINSIADLVNNDPVVSRKIKVAFIENFSVSNGQLIYPAADFSEQISTAGKEASGTGCMKFIMNGAVTLGTLDGANIEIMEKVGKENVKIFGLTADQITDIRRRGGYHSSEEAEKDPILKKLTSQLVDGTFRESGCDFWGIYDSLIMHNDEYFVLKDFPAYMNAWRELDKLYSDRDKWGKMSLANIAHSGYFSSDRTIREYADDIWKVKYTKTITRG